MYRVAGGMAPCMSMAESLSKLADISRSPLGNLQHGDGLKTATPKPIPAPSSEVARFSHVVLAGINQ